MLLDNATTQGSKQGFSRGRPCRDSDSSARLSPPTPMVWEAPPGASRYSNAKILVEALIACVLLTLFLPLILVAAFLVKLTSRGPAFYSQVRLGLRGRPFRIHKIRTMVHDCEAGTGPCWSSPGDPRVTRLGQILRRTHLDELPQLVNVIAGQMSLIGPRPERPEFFPVLEKAVRSYRSRLAVRPGVTGLAQVQLPADTDLGSVRRKLNYDLYYIRHAGLLLDLRILLATALYVTGVRGHSIRRICRLPDPAAIEHTGAGYMPGPRQLRICFEPAASGAIKSH